MQQQTAARIPPLPCPACNHPITSAKLRDSIDHPRYTCKRCSHVFSSPRKQVNIEEICKAKVAPGFTTKISKFNIRQILLPWPNPGNSADCHYATAVELAMQTLLANGHQPPVLLRSTNFAPQWVVDGQRQRILVLDAEGKITDSVYFEGHSAKSIEQLRKVEPAAQTYGDNGEVKPIACERPGCCGRALWMYRAEMYQCFSCKWTKK